MYPSSQSGTPISEAKKIDLLDVFVYLLALFMQYFVTQFLNIHVVESLLFSLLASRFLILLSILLTIVLIDAYFPLCGKNVKVIK